MKQYLALFILLITSGVTVAQEPKVDFDRQIRPILSNTCFTCHGPDANQRQAELRLDTKAGAFAEHDGSPVLVPGKLDQSEVYRRITSTDPDEVMPPVDQKQQLSKSDQELIKRWIEQGANWEEHWSFVAPTKPALPMVQDAPAHATSLDSFVLARLAKEQLQLAPRAEKITLLRRVTLDLTGLPPTLAEVDAFLADDSPQAYEKVVDRLLESPRFGEHFAWDWLNAARYADSNGYQQDRTRTLWPWRDWVIDAINNNMPYDQFTLWQLAGDLLPDATMKQKVATGFHRNHMLNGEGGRIAEESRVEYVIDRVETTGTVWLGLTVGCARCHDHKYDPVSQQEFYELYAYFNNIDESGRVDAGGNARPVMKVPTAEQAKQRQSLEQQITVAKTKFERASTTEQQTVWETEAQKAIAAKTSKLPENIVTALQVQADKRSAEQKKQLREQFLKSVPEVAAAKKRLDDLTKKRDDLVKSIVETMVMQERGSPRETYRLERGVWNKPDKLKKLFPGTPAVLPSLPQDAPKTRLALARWIIDPQHPLTARVTVNRAWQHFFGKGLVKTTEDFGTQGERPTHPQLLDWLAVTLVEAKWDMKALYKTIVMSATYQQSSKMSPTQLERDPYNELLARGPRLRLGSQALRDQALFVSGLLVEKIGGPPVKPYQPLGIWSDLSLGKIKYQRDSGEKLYRRSLYTFWRRASGPTMLFDIPARQVCSVRESRTNTPLHALTLMNDITFMEASRVFAQRVLAEGGDTPENRLSYAFRLATLRKPQPRELNAMIEILSDIETHYKTKTEEAQKLIKVGEAPQPEGVNVIELASYTSLMNLILNLDEVLTKE